MLLVLIHLRTNLTTRALAALFGHQTNGSGPLHPPPGADTCRHAATRPQPARAWVWIIDGALIPLHDQTITAVEKLPPQRQHPDHRLRPRSPGGRGRRLPAR